MDKRKGILNIGTSIGSKVVLLLAALYIRRLLIVCVGNEANGLNSLYGSIIGLLAVAELGVGSAIVFSMYKPIIDGDKGKVAALYCLYQKLYRIIGAVILIAGLCVMPFLPRLIEDFDALDINVYVTFLLALISVVISYLYSAKTSLIEAHKNNYITTSIITVFALLSYGMQVVVLVLWQSFTLFLVCHIIETILVGCATEWVVRKLYPDIVHRKEVLDTVTKKEVSKNVKAMFMHKIGGTLVNVVDSLIISAFIGVVILGKYSNYLAIANAMMGIITLVFISLTTVIGHLCASNKPEDIKRYFNHFYTSNYILGIIFFLGYFAVIDNLVSLLFGKGLEMTRMISFVITLNLFIQYLRSTQNVFRDASGVFYYDRWKPLGEGVANLVMSIMFVKILPDEFSVVGVVVATIITNLLICDIVEPHVVYKYVFKEPARRFYLRQYCGIGLFIICLIAMEHLKIDSGSDLTELLINGLISLGVSAAVIVLLSVLDKQFRQEFLIILFQAKAWVKKIVLNRENRV